MPNKGDTVYWDSNVFLSYINGHAARLPVIDAVLEESQRGDLTIITSTISLTEVAFAEMEKQNRVLEPAQEQAIDALFSDREVVTLIDFHELVAREARRLLRLAVEAGRKLTPMDAIHLATAIRQNADVLHTYDGPLTKIGRELFGFRVEEPTSQNPKLDLP